MKKILFVSLLLSFITFALLKYDDQEMIDKRDKLYPGRYSGQTYQIVDPSTEQFPQESTETTSCTKNIYYQKRKRFKLNPPFLYKEHDKGYFSAFEFNKCYFSPMHQHSYNLYWDFPHNYKIEYDKANNKFRLLQYKDGTSNTESGDVGCKGTYTATEWYTLAEFNTNIAKKSYFKVTAEFSLRTESIDYAIYTSYNSNSGDCKEKEYAERLYYKYDIYWSFNSDQNGWYLVKYRVVQPPNAAMTVDRFDQYWGEYGIEQVQNTWCSDGQLTCGSCYGPSAVSYQYVECGKDNMNSEEKASDSSKFLNLKIYLSIIGLFCLVF